MNAARKGFLATFMLMMAGAAALASGAAGDTELVSSRLPGQTTANALSIGARISTNGKYVVFNSVATDLVPSDTNGRIDVFVRDLETGATERISVSSSEAEANGDSGLI